jgi:iron complex transport system substrate-binding protein
MAENYTPQRIASLQPSVTVTLRDLGLLRKLVACTKYCADICPQIKQTQCVIIEDSWSAKAEQIAAASPDLVIASVPYRLESVAEIIKSGVPFLGLAPHSLDDVYKDILLIARAAGCDQPGEAERRGLELVERMQQEIALVRQKTSGSPGPPAPGLPDCAGFAQSGMAARAGVARDGVEAQHPPLVYCEEWGKPLILSQPWVAELVEAAGGRFFGQPGKQATEEEVAAADPEVIIAAWCGAGDRVPLEKIIARRGWENTKAARSGRVYCINDEFLNTPASTLVNGLHALAAAIHPERFEAPVGLRRTEGKLVTW